MALNKCLDGLDFDSEEAIAIRKIARETGGEIEGVEKHMADLAREEQSLRDQISDHGFDSTVKPPAAAAGTPARAALFQGGSSFRKTGETILPQAADPAPDDLADALAETKRDLASVHRRLPIVIPESQRVASSPYVVGAPGGRRWQDLSPADLSARGTGTSITQADLDNIHDEVLSRISQAAQKAVEETGASFQLTVDELNKAFSLPLRAQLWYELSAERFKEGLPDLSFDEHFIFLDLVGATSARTEPYDNLARSLSVLSQNLRGVPIDTDLAMPAPVNRALAREGEGVSNLTGNKTGQFSNTFALTGGMETAYPIPVNDVWVGRMFGVTDKQLTQHQSLHEFMALYQIELTAAIRNQGDAGSSIPHQPWHLQARTWVELRSADQGVDTSEPGDIEGNDYAAEWPRVVALLRSKGIPGVSADGVISREALMHPGFTDAIRPTVAAFREAPKATVEVGTLLTTKGKYAVDLVEAANAVGDEVTAANYLEAITATLFNSGRSGFAKPGWRELVRAITGEARALTRIEAASGTGPYAVAGSFEGVLSPNIRVPLKDMTDPQIAVFNAVVGKALNQAAMAASTVLPADPSGAAREGYTPGISLFIQTTDGLSKVQLETFAQALPEGHDISSHATPGGVVIDINPAFGDQGPVGITQSGVDTAALALEATGISATDVKQFAVDHRSVYTEASEYDATIAAFDEEMRNGAAEELKALGVSAKDAAGIVGTRTPVTSKVLGKVRSAIRGRATTVAKRLSRRLDSFASAQGAFQGLATDLETRLEKDFAKAEKRIKRLGGTVPSKAAAPLFQDEEGPLGSFDASDLSNLTINLFGAADLSTLLHETGHLFVHMMDRMAALPGASQRLKDNHRNLLDWVGADSASDLNLDISGEAARLKQEKLATAWEAYIREGKAPNAKLRNAFSQLSHWLVEIYRRWRQLDAPIDDDIRQVFDRMLATDAQIAEMKSINAFDPADNAATLALMTPEERTLWTANNEAADELARNEAARVHHEARLRAEQDVWLEEAARIEKSVTNALWSETPYRALWFLSRGVFRDADTPAAMANMRLSRRALVAKVENGGLGMTEEQLEGIPKAPKGKRIYTTKDEQAMDPVVLAQFLGFDTAEELLNTLINLPPAEQIIEVEVARIMEARHPSPIANGELEQLTEEALYNEERRQTLQIELDALARASGQDKVSRQAVQAIVDSIVAQRPVGELVNPSVYISAAIRAAGASARAAAKGDHVRAFEEKRKQMLNHELLRRTTKIRKDVEKALKYMRKFDTRGKWKAIQADYLDRIRELTGSYNLDSRLSKKGAEKLNVQAFLEWKARAEAQDGAILMIPQPVLDDAGKMHWRTLTHGQLMGIHDVVKSIERQGRFAKKAISAQEERDRSQILSEIEARTLDMPQTKAAKREAIRKQAWYDPALSTMRSFDAAMLKIEFLLEFMDGAKIGPAQRGIFEPFVDAERAENDLVKTFSEQFADAYEKMPAKVRRNIAKPVWNAALGTYFSRAQLIHMALNVGNASNLAKMVEGSKKTVLEGSVSFTETEIMEAISDLSAQEIAFINTVWRLFEDMRPAVGEVWRKENGDPPIWMDPIETELPNGQLTGGYIPMMYDPRQSKQAADIDGKTALEAMQSEVVQAGVFSGMTKERSHKFSAPVLMDITRIPGELQKTAHFITHYQAVRNARKLIGDERLQRVVVNKFGHEYYEILRSWVGQVAEGGRQGTRFNKIDDTIEWMRANTTVTIMGASVTTTMTQPLGAFTAVDALAEGIDGKKYKVGRAALAFIKALMAGFVPGSNAQAVAASKELKFRRDMSDRDIQHALKKMAGMKGKKAQTQRFLLMAIPAMQYYTVDLPTWKAAYELAMNDGLSQEQAVALADSTMRKSQGSGSVKDLSAMMAQRGSSRAVTMFMTFFNTLYAIQRRRGRRWKGLTKGELSLTALHRLATGALILYILPSIVEGIFRLEGPDEEDDPAAYVEWLALKSLMFAGSTVPIARDFVSGIGYGFGYNPTPLAGAGESVVRMWNEAYKIMEDDGEIGANTLKIVVTMMGFATGVVPANQLKRAIDSWAELETSPRDFNYWQFAVGLDRRDK